MSENRTLKDVFQKYQSIIFNNILHQRPDDVDSLTYWRINILFSMIFAAVLIGLPVFLSVIPMAVKEKLWGLLFFDTMAVIAGLLLLTWPRLGIKKRSLISIFMLFLIGLMVILNVGPLSGGPAWLFAFAVLSGVLLGFRAAILAINLNIVTITMLIVLKANGLWGADLPWFVSASHMGAAAINFIFLNAVVAISVSVLVEGMTQSHEKEKQLAQSLNRERIKLLESQERLEKEIIEHEQTEKALSDSEKKYRYLFNNAPAGIYEIDFGRFRFLEVNNVLCTISGYSQKELLDVDPRSLLTEKSRRLFEKRFEDLQSGKTKNLQMEYEIVTKDGHKKDVVLNNDYIFDDGVLAGARVVVHDITQQKKMQNMIVQSEKMMSVGGLAAGMAHEINNPLAGIMQNAQVVENRLIQEIPGNLKAARESGTSFEAIGRYMEKRGIYNQLKRIRQAGGRAAEIVDNMLSFARKSDSVKMPQNIAELLDKTLVLAQNDYTLQQRFDFKNIEIIRQYDPDIAMVLCNEIKIEQVFFNLIKNASESMAQSGVLHPKLICRIAAEDEAVRVEIIDNGPGMDMDTQNRIFEPFFTTKKVGEGTGLGLSVSYFIIVEDHGGELRVESRPGDNTRFIVKIPIKSERR